MKDLEQKTNSPSKGDHPHLSLSDAITKSDVLYADYQFQETYEVLEPHR
jgi:hypothetical protein